MLLRLFLVTQPPSNIFVGQYVKMLVHGEEMGTFPSLPLQKGLMAQFYQAKEERVKMAIAVSCTGIE